MTVSDGIAAGSLAVALVSVILTAAGVAAALLSWRASRRAVRAAEVSAEHGRRSADAAERAAREAEAAGHRARRPVLTLEPVTVEGRDAWTLVLRSPEALDVVDAEAQADPTDPQATRHRLVPLGTTRPTVPRLTLGPLQPGEATTPPFALSDGPGIRITITCHATRGDGRPWHLTEDIPPPKRRPRSTSF